MRKIIFIVLLSNLAMVCQASDKVNQPDNSWYDSAKKNAETMLDKTKKAASEGLDKTTIFINKTGQATKQGFKAFKKSFANDKPSPAKTAANNQAFPPAYLNVEGFKLCLSIKDVDTAQMYCLSKYRPAPCDKSIFEKLNKLKSPAPC